MKLGNLLILLHFNMVFSLEDEKGVCDQIQRRVRRIEIGPGKFKEIVDRVRKPYCCPGYKKSFNGTKVFCEPKCEQPCVHGSCIKPNTCECEKNYNGTLCDIRLCPAGYKGQTCQEKCSKNYFGQNCAEECTCQNGWCDPINGYCHCDIGWTGATCLEKCSNGTYGLNCSKNCKCQNDGICDPITGKCECATGYIGQYCEDRCKEGYWGDNCTYSCDCPKTKCNPIDGTCDIICQNGIYINDTCKCDKNWTGQFCSEMLCPDGFYGDNCKDECSCEKETTKTCEQETGLCVCQLGWSGKRCDQPCPPMTFGQNCTHACKCYTDHYYDCDTITGKCNCKSGWTGEFCETQCLCKNGKCNDVGKCDCNAGWKGDNCDQECENGYYGPGCRNLCLMNGLGNNLCDPVIGPICKAGFSMKSNCTLPCEDGTYGIHCKNCLCQNDSKCNKVTGTCECLPGWYGHKCEKQCPDYYYGKYCTSSCKCKNCRATDGFCKCQDGWNGSYCQDYCPEYYFNISSNECVEIDNIILLPLSVASKTAASVILGTGILIGCTFFFIIFFYMKKKEEKDSIDHRRRTSSNTYIEKLHL